MNGTDSVSLPKFWEGAVLPVGYCDEPDPYESKPSPCYDLGAIIEYARKRGIDVRELSMDEIKRFPSGKLN